MRDRMLETVSFILMGRNHAFVLLRSLICVLLIIIDRLLMILFFFSFSDF